MEVVEARTFGNDEGNKVMGFLKIDPKTYEIDLTEPPAFNGEVIVGTQRGPMSFTFDFPEGYTLEQCFEHFNEIAEDDEKYNEIAIAFEKEFGDRVDELDPNSHFYYDKNEVDLG